MKSLWDHQKKAISNAENLDHYALFMDPGLGKTRTAIEIVRDKYIKAERLLRTLIIGPTIVMENWRREWMEYSQIKDENIVVLRGDGKKRVSLIKERCFSDAIPLGRIVVTNYEAIVAVKGLKDLLKLWRPEVIICDESHKIKSSSAKRTGAVIELGDLSTYRYILTGTPVLQNYMDIYSQYRFLDKGKLFGDNFFIFRNTYFYDKNAGMPSHVHFPDWALKAHVEDDIHTRLHSCSMSAKKEDCLDLPPFVEKKVYVELSKQQARLYEDMRDKFIAFLDDEACTAQLAITKGLRLQQIVSGFMVTDEGETIALEENPRAKALEELLEDLAPNHKIIVWACWRENYKQIKAVCEKLKLPFVEIHGGVAQGQRQEAVDKFNNDPSIRVFIGNQGAAGIGINLIASDIMIYYSRNFSLEHDIQSEARNFRAGSEIHAKVTRIDIVARETIDEKVLEALSQKQIIGDKILKQLVQF